MKNPIFLIVFGMVVVGGSYSAYSFLSSPRLANTEQGNTENTENELAVQVEEYSDATSGSFAALVLGKKNLECTFEQNDGTNISSGTVYLAENAARIRGDFTIQQSGAGPMEAHLIRDSGYNYLWGPFFPQGMKSQVTAEEQGKLFSSKDGNGIDEDVTFDCKPWRVDSGVFSKPSDIEFMEIGVQSGVIDNGKTINDLEAIKKQQCDAKVCDQAPEGIPRQQCLQALGC